MMTEARLLSECGEKLVIDDSEKDRYEIAIAPGDDIVVMMGFKSNHPAAKFTCEGIAATNNEIHEFKHYCRSGRKFWTSHAGVNHYLVVPKNQIKLLPEKGYSYVKAEINGVKVSFNVSGGGGSDGWRDWLGNTASVGVNHPLKALKAVAAVARKGVKLEVKQLSEDDMLAWRKLAAKTGSAKETIIGLVEAGKKPTIILGARYSFQGRTIGQGVEAVRKYMRSNYTPCDIKVGDYENSRRIVPIGAVKAVMVAFGEGYCNQARVKMTQIDWLATATANGIEA